MSNFITARNLAQRAADQRRLATVEDAARHLAQAIANAMAPDPARLDGIRAAITNEYNRCQKPRANASRPSGKFLLPDDDNNEQPIVNKAGAARVNGFLLPEGD